MKNEPKWARFSLSKNFAKDFRDRAAGECEGAKSPPRVKLKPRKWLISAIFSILRYSKCVGQIAKKSQRDFFDDLKNEPKWARFFAP